MSSEPWCFGMNKFSCLPVGVERDFGSPSQVLRAIFEGTNEGKVYARIVLPKIEEKVPLIFHFHGYMGTGKLIGWCRSSILWLVTVLSRSEANCHSQDGLCLQLEIPLWHIIRGAVKVEISSLCDAHPIFTSWSRLLLVCHDEESIF